MVTRLIRNNKKSETTMINLINDHSTSAWKMSTVELFLSYRHRELETVSMITKEANNDVVLEESGNGNGNKCLFQHQFTIQFTLNVLPNPNVTDEYLKSPHKYSEEHKWYWNEQLVSLSGARHLYFMNFYKHNKPNKELSVCYLIKLKKASTVRANSGQAIEEENYDDNEDGLELKKEKELSKRVRIDVIKAGRKIVKNLRPPRKLKVPDTVEVDYNTIYFSLNYGRNVSNYDDIKPSARNTIKIMYAYAPDTTGEVDDPKNITAIQRVKIGERDKTRIRLRNLRPATKYFISLHVAYDFGDDPDSTMFAVMTPECASPKLSKPMDGHIKMNEITLKWVEPNNCKDKPTLSYKIVYKKLNFSRILGDDDTADISDANTMIVDGNIGGTPVESTTLKGLESLSEYLITIEAVVSNKTISQPPPPKIIINNQRSMQVVWTKPKPPEKLTVVQHENTTWNITWNAIETDIDESRVLYNLKINELTIKNKTECPYDPAALPGGHLPEECRYTVRNETFHETLKTSLRHQFAPLRRVYQFAIKVKTPYGESEYSTSVIKELNVTDPSSTRNSIKRINEIELNNDDHAKPIPAERIVEDLSEALFVGEGKGHSYV